MKERLVPRSPFEGVGIRVIIAEVNNLIELLLDAFSLFHLLIPHLELRGLHWLLLCSDRTFTDSRALVSKYVLGITLACRCFDRKLCLLVQTLCSKLAAYLLSDRLLRLGRLNRDQRKLTKLALSFALPLGSTEYVIRVSPLRICVTHDK